MALLESAQIARLLDIAFVSAHAGKVRDANTIFDAILAVDPNSTPAKIGLGLTHIMVDQFSKAEEILLEIIEANPNDQEALGVLSLGYLINGDTQKAKESAQKMDMSDENSETAILAKEILAAA